MLAASPLAASPLGAPVTGPVHSYDHPLALTALGIDRGVGALGIARGLVGLNIDRTLTTD